MVYQSKMAENTRTAESEVVEEVTKEVPDFDAEKAANTEGFAEFQALYKDPEDFKYTAEVIKDRFEIFQKAQEVFEGVKETYGDQVFLDLGIKLDDEDFGLVEAELLKQAVEKPDELKFLGSELAFFQKYPQQIADLEGELKLYAGTDNLENFLDTKKITKTLLSDTQEYWGKMGKTQLFGEKLDNALLDKPIQGIKNIFNRMFNKPVDHAKTEEFKLKDKEIDYQKKALNLLEDEIGKRSIDGYTKELLAAEIAIANIESIQEKKKRFEEVFGEAKNNVLTQISQIAGFAEIIQQKINDQLGEILREQNVASLEQAQIRLHELEEKNEEQIYGVDLLKMMPGEFVKNVDKRLGKEISAEMTQVMEKSTLGDGALAKLENSLKPLLLRDKIGTREGKNLRTFLKSSLMSAATNIKGTSVDAYAKRYLVQQLISKMDK